jgi:hypothetical protein
LFKNEDLTFWNCGREKHRRRRKERTEKEGKTESKKNAFDYPGHFASYWQAALKAKHENKRGIYDTLQMKENMYIISCNRVIRFTLAARLNATKCHCSALSSLGYEKRLEVGTPSTRNNVPSNFRVTSSMVSGDPGLREPHPDNVAVAVDAWGNHPTPPPDPARNGRVDS